MFVPLLSHAGRYFWDTLPTLAVYTVVALKRRVEGLNMLHCYIVTLVFSLRNTKKSHDGNQQLPESNWGPERHAMADALPPRQVTAVAAALLGHIRLLVLALYTLSTYSTIYALYTLW